MFCLTSFGHRVHLIKTWSVSSSFCLTGSVYQISRHVNVSENFTRLFTEWAESLSCFSLEKLQQQTMRPESLNIFKSNESIPTSYILHEGCSGNLSVVWFHAIALYQFSLLSSCLVSWVCPYVFVFIPFSHRTPSLACSSPCSLSAILPLFPVCLSLHAPASQVCLPTFRPSVALALSLLIYLLVSLCISLFALSACLWLTLFFLLCVSVSPAVRVSLFL